MPEVKESKRMFCRICIIVALFALVVNLFAGFCFGISRPIESDGDYYLQLAQSLASGNGYKVTRGFWPEAPSMRRLPGWPAVVAAALKAAPGAHPDTLMRVLALLTNAAAAAAVCAMTVRILRRTPPAFFAGIFYACHPEGIYYALNGFSEPLFILLVASGITCLLPPLRLDDEVVPAGRSADVLNRPSGIPVPFREISGGIILGCASLVRAGFAVWPLIVIGLVVLRRLAGKWRVDCTGRLPALTIALLISFLPPLLWMQRNYRVSGAFPVLSSLRGQTFYGGNNPVVADDREYWGYWVFPDRIPGEIPMVELARTMSEHEVDRYYYNRGKDYVLKHARDYPGLLLGKLVRAYVPWPWHPTAGSVAVSVYRWMLYCGVLLGLCSFRQHRDTMYGIFLAAMLLTSVLTVLIFWGCARFAFAIEPFLLPPAAMPAVSIVARFKRFRRSRFPCTFS